MTQPTKIRMTAAEFLQLPESNLPAELIDGEIMRMTAPELDHQDVVGDIFILFKNAASAQGGKAYVAPVDVYLDENNVPQPDVLWLSPDSLCQPVGTKRLSSPPDLIAEVVSPGTARQDKRVKFRLYERAGVREYWIVDPRDKLVEVWQRQEGVFVLLDVYSVGETFTSALIGEVNCGSIFTG